MPKAPLAGFRDHRRARYLVWSGVTVLALAALVVIAFGATSTYWFCANACHKVQDDTIEAYRRSSHALVSCMSCHEPVNADPVTFTLKKAKALGELVLTVSGRYELPLNPESELAQDAHEMGSGQCTQCHDLKTRTITPSPGIIIDHDIHAANDVHCTMCHNRVAHREDFDLALKDPRTGKPNRKHEDFMTMEGCFRQEGCHGLEPGYRAPGECSKCHPPNFELKPASHEEPGFYTPGGESSGHWKLKEARPGYCRICHLESRFCVDCHGVEMPHPKDFVKTHGKVGKASPKTCARCHAKGVKPTSANDMRFCNTCHHKDADPTRDWIPQHFEAVKKSGAQACFECHDPTYCAKCHVRSVTR